MTTFDEIKKLEGKWVLIFADATKVLADSVHISDYVLIKIKKLTDGPDYAGYLLEKEPGCQIGSFKKRETLPSNSPLADFMYIGYLEASNMLVQLQDSDKKAPIFKMIQKLNNETKPEVENA